MKVVAFFFYNNQNYLTSPVHISKRSDNSYFFRPKLQWQRLAVTCEFLPKTNLFVEKKIILILLKKFNSSWFDWSVDAKAMLVCFSNFYVASPLFTYHQGDKKQTWESSLHNIWKKEAIIY